MAIDGGPRVFERKIGFPFFYAFLFLFISAALPLLIAKYSTRTVPGDMLGWVLGSLISGGLFVYELLQWRKTLRLALDGDGIGFNMLHEPREMRIPWKDIQSFEYHPVSRGKDAISIRLKENAQKPWWQPSGDPVLKDHYGVKFRQMAPLLKAALDEFNGQ